jgi:fatty acid desaturase
MSNTSNTTSGTPAIGFLPALAILFIALKLTNLITWSWWWVLSPLWIPFAIVLVVGIIWFFFVVYKSTK